MENRPADPSDRRPGGVPNVILITGLPCTGKSTLARRLSAEFRLPLLAKDGIKEVLFDSLGWKDRQWSREMSRTSFELIFHLMEILLSTRLSFIVEGNFKAADHTERWLALKHFQAFEFFRILCFAEGETLWKRFKARADGEYRHPGHLDRATLAEFKPLLLAGRDTPLPIGGPLLEFDTTDAAAVDTAAVITAIRAFLNRNRPDNRQQPDLW